MPKEFSRTQRVEKQIRRELADIIHREINKPQLGMFTISAIKVSPDLKFARVYFTMLGGQLTAQQVTDYFNEAAGWLRHHLSQRLTTRVTPTLSFEYDTSIEYGSRLSALIDSLPK